MTTTAVRRLRRKQVGVPYEQVVIHSVQPVVAGGRHPVKAVVGDLVTVEATVFPHGHDRVRVAVQWRRPDDTTFRESPMTLIFLAEAFTRPPMMQALAMRGFTQSYTYFTWRNTKAELTEYLTELTRPDMASCFRPNFFVNTPDILPPILQEGGPPAFKSRLVLAATLASSYGIYSGFELCEHAAIEGREEYLDSEKYAIKVRDWNAPGNIKAFITRVNRARHANPALRQFTNLRFLDIDNDQLIAYVKDTPDGVNRVIVVVSLDPAAAYAGTVRVPPEAVGVAPGGSYGVHDLLTGNQYVWAEWNHVHLDPAAGEPVHIFRVDSA